MTLKSRSPERERRAKVLSSPERQRHQGANVSDSFNTQNMKLVSKSPERQRPQPVVEEKKEEPSHRDSLASFGDMQSKPAEVKPVPPPPQPVVVKRVPAKPTISPYVSAYSTLACAMR